MSGAPAVLSLEGIVKRFGDVTALADASFALRPGSVHALLGENGAGKTTLMRIAYGMLHADGGTVRIDGEVRRFRSSADAIAAGIGMVHQHFTLVPAMTVAENVALGGRGRFDARNTGARIREVAAEAGLAVDADARVSSLSISAQQRVEIVKALARHARILILDEPTAVLAPSEADELLRHIRRFADAGRAVILITHKLREALGVADDVTVLRHGATVLAGSRPAVSEEALLEAMLGRQLPGTTPPWSVHDASLAGDPGDGVIRAREISVADERGLLRIKRASFDINSGEIVGVAAVEGSGYRELLRALAGRRMVVSGSLHLPDTIGFVPDDRHREALVLDMSLTENHALRGAGSRRGRMRWHQISVATAALIVRHDIRAHGPDVSARVLSGGNQQKFVLARELDPRPAALVAENPTRGLDIRAAAVVHDRLREARDNGVAVVAYSADLDEVLALADRVLTVFAGEVREAPREREAVGRAMLGAE